MIAEEKKVTPMKKHCEKVANGLRAEGEAKGVILTLSGLVKDGVLSIKEAASRAKMTEPEFVESMRKYSESANSTTENEDNVQ